MAYVDPPQVIQIYNADGKTIRKLQDGQYLADNEESTEPKDYVEGDSYVIYYADNTLTLNGYNGGMIEVGAPKGKTLTVELVGDNNTITATQSGQSSKTSQRYRNPLVGLSTSSRGKIQSNSGFPFHDGVNPLVIEGSGSLSINLDGSGESNSENNASVNAYGLAGNRITITDKANVNIHVIVDSSKMDNPVAKGIYAGYGVTVDSEGKLDVTAEVKDDEGRTGRAWGIHTTAGMVSLSGGEKTVQALHTSEQCDNRFTWGIVSEGWWTYDRKTMPTSGWVQVKDCSLTINSSTYGIVARQSTLTDDSTRESYTTLYPEGGRIVFDNATVTMGTSTKGRWTFGEVIGLHTEGGYHGNNEPDIIIQNSILTIGDEGTTGDYTYDRGIYSENNGILIQDSQVDIYANTAALDIGAADGSDYESTYGINISGGSIANLKTFGAVTSSAQAAPIRTASTMAALKESPINVIDLSQGGSVTLERTADANDEVSGDLLPVVGYLFEGGHTICSDEAKAVQHPNDDNAALYYTSQSGYTQTFKYTSDTKLTFRDSADYDIPGGPAEKDITPIDLTGAITIADGKTATFKLENGPDWLEVSEDGQITGTRPAVPAAKMTAKISVTDGTTTKSIWINVGAVTKLIYTNNGELDVPSGGVRDSIKYIVISKTVSGGVEPYKFELVDAPSWLYIDPYKYTEGTLMRGTRPRTPAAATTFTIRCTDAVGDVAEITIQVGEVTGPLTANVPDDVEIPTDLINVPIEAIDASKFVAGGRAPYKYKITEGPVWLNVDENTGVVTGTRPNKYFADSVLKIQVTDSLNATTTMSIDVNRVLTQWPALNFENTDGAANIPEGHSGEAITSIRLSRLASGGKAPYTYSIVSGPNWLSVNETTGVVTGTRPADAAAATTVTFRVTDSKNQQKDMTATVGAVIAQLMMENNDAYAVPKGRVGKALKAAIDVSQAAKNGKAPYTFSLVDPDSTWLTITPDGKLSGTRPAEEAAATTVQVRVTDAENTTADMEIPVGEVVLHMPELIIQLDANGGECEAAALQTVDQVLTDLPKPTLSGYVFNGWFTQAEGGVQITDTYEFEENTTIFAHWTKEAPVIPSGGGGGGASAARTYPVSTPSGIAGGKVGGDFKNAVAGTKVTLTVTPDEGFELAGLKVLDEDGKALPVTDLGNGKYSFTMPSSKVTVQPAFVQSKTNEDADKPFGSGETFTDVTEKDYFYRAVAWAVENGITGGLGNGLFGPNAPCSRAQIVTFLWRAAGSPAPKTTQNPFTDVSADQYYYAAVLWAVENGITSGTTVTTFGPEDTCNRAQAVTFLFHALGSEVEGGQSFGDVATDIWYAKAVQWAVAKQITAGVGGGLFGPDMTCTRAQILTLLYQAYQNK